MSTNAFWSAELQQMPATAPAVIGDTVIVASQDSGVTALHTTLRGYDLNSGEVKWRQTIEYGLVTGLSSYTAENQRPLVLITTMGSDFLNGEAGLWAIDESGSEVWRWEGDGESFSDVMIYYDAQLANHLAICTIDASMLLAVHPLNGKQKAYAAIPSDTSVAAPAYHNGMVILPTRGPDVTAVDLDGQQRWQYKSSAQIWFDKTPVIIGSSVVVTSSQGIAAGLDLLTGEKKWEKTIGPADKPLSSAATDGALVYVGSREGLHALDPALGKVLWTTPIERGITTHPLIFDKLIAVTCTDHFVRLLDSHSGDEHWAYELSRRIEAAPAWPIFKKIIAADRGGRLVCIENSLEEPQQAFTVQNLATKILDTQTPESMRKMARQYELDEQWDKAAELWLKLERFQRYAQALEEHARVLSDDQMTTFEERAAAWEAAAQAYTEEGEKEDANLCYYEVARYRQLPVVTLDLEHEGLVCDEWSRLNMTIRNEGFGTAYFLTVRSIDNGQFEGQLASTLAFAHLAVRRKRVSELDVRPLQHGKTVPLRLAIQYIDEDKESHEQSQTIYIPVARVAAERTGGQMLGDVFANAIIDPLAEAAGENADTKMIRHLYLSCQEYLSKDELISIAFGMGLDPDNLPERKSTMVREMISYVSRRNRLEEFIGMCEQANSDISWR